MISARAILLSLLLVGLIFLVAPALRMTMLAWENGPVIGSVVMVLVAIIGAGLWLRSRRQGKLE